MSYLEPETAPVQESPSAGAQGFYIDVYENKIVFRGMDFADNKNVLRLPTAYMKINLYDARTTLSGLNPGETCELYCAGLGMKRARADENGVLSLEIFPGNRTLYAVGTQKTRIYTVTDGNAVQSGEIDNSEISISAFDIGGGPVLINDTVASGTNLRGEPIEVPSAGKITITGTTSENAISVTGGSHTVELKGVNIQTAAAPIQLQGSASVTLSLKGMNTLISSGAPALHAPSGTTLIIEGSENDTLSATTVSNYHAAVGGAKKQSAGKITINGGNIIADAGGEPNALYGAGIGGGEGGGAELITINGGIVEAYGGNLQTDSWAGGAGIGGGEAYGGSSGMKSKHDGPPVRGYNVPRADGPFLV